MLNSIAMQMKIKDLTDIVTHNLKEWTHLLSEKDKPTLLKMGALKGAFFTFGISDLHYEVEKQLDQTNEMKNCLKQIMKIIEKSNDNLVSLTAARLLGQLHLSVAMTTTSSGNLPTSLSYLGDSSILSGIFDVCLNVCTASSHDTFRLEKLNACFQAIINTNCDKLPPVNWSLVLTPSLRFNGDVTEDVSDFKMLVFEFVLKFSNNDLNISLWLSSWIQTTSFCKLGENVRLYLFKNITTILPCLSNNKQKMLLEDLMESSIKTSAAKGNMLGCVLSAWLSVAEMSVPIKSTISYVIEGLKKFPRMPKVR